MESLKRPFRFNNNIRVAKLSAKLQESSYASPGRYVCFVSTHKGSIGLVLDGSVYRVFWEASGEDW